MVLLLLLLLPPIFVENAKNLKCALLKAARGIIKLLPYSFDVHLGWIDHPELEEKL